MNKSDNNKNLRLIEKDVIIYLNSNSPIDLLNIIG